jgi:hypothetical protein
MIYALESTVTIIVLPGRALRRDEINSIPRADSDGQQKQPELCSLRVPIFTQSVIISSSKLQSTLLSITWATMFRTIGISTAVRPFLSTVLGQVHPQSAVDMKAAPQFGT